VADTVEDVVARNLRRLRTARGWTQSDLALRMRGAGFANWRANRVTQVETQRRAVSLAELLMLSWVLGEPLARFVDGAGDVELPGGQAVALKDVQAIVAGDITGTGEPPRVSPGAPADELRRIARQLDLPVDVLEFLARSLYGHGFMEERDARTGDVTGMDKRSAQTKRGLATRTIAAELAGFLRGEGARERLHQGYLAATGG
jgi:transcriptional regulator with XRE-family HTH domain